MATVDFTELDGIARARPEPVIDVFLFDCDAPPIREQLLDDDEQLRCSRFATPTLQRRFRACHATKRALLAHYSGLEAATLAFTRGRFDKPVLRDSRLHFNLSHSHQWAQLAIAPVEVGVDCERIDPTIDFHSLLPTVAHRHERIVQRDGFFHVWSRKEAVLKQLGLGFQLAPPRLRVPDDPYALDGWRAVQSDAAPMPLVHDLPAPSGFVSALAAAAPAPIRVFHLLAARSSEPAR